MSSFTWIPSGPRCPLIFCCEHASPLIPEGYLDLGLSAELRYSHWGWDIGAFETARSLAASLGAGLLAGSYSRLLVDLNRAPTESTWIVESLAAQPIPGNRALPDRERRLRLEAYWEPYHQALDEQLRMAQALHGEALRLLSIHSFTDRWPGQDRDFDIGVLYESHEQSMGERLRASLENVGARARSNEPYSGLRGEMYSVSRRWRELGVRGLEIELNQSIVASESGRRRAAAWLNQALREEGVLN